MHSSGTGLPIGFISITCFSLPDGFLRWPCFFTLIEIHPGAQLGHGILIDHGCGVVIGETTVVGDNCTIYQGVTLGGVGTQKGKRHPTLGNNVTVGAGAKILGAFEVGDNCTIAANAVLLKPLENNITAAGIPARPVKKDGMRLPKEEKPILTMNITARGRTDQGAGEADQSAGEADRSAPLSLPVNEFPHRFES